MSENWMTTICNGAKMNSSLQSEGKNHLSSTESNLLTRTTIYTTLQAIDQGKLATSGSVKLASRKRLVDWCQSLSENFHQSKPRLDCKNNGARPNRPEETATNLEQRGLMIGKKDFLVTTGSTTSQRKKKRKFTMANKNEVTENEPCTLRHKRRKRIFHRLSSRLADTITTKTNNPAATLQYLQNLSKCWQQYYRKVKDKPTHGLEGPIASTMCWIGAPVIHQGKEAIICGERRDAWCLCRLDSAKIVYVTQHNKLQVSIVDEKDGSYERFCIQV